MRAIHTLSALALLACPGLAAAADHELSLELGTSGTHQDNWYMFNNDAQRLPTAGLRLGVAVHDGRPGPPQAVPQPEGVRGLRVRLVGLAQPGHSRVDVLPPFHLWIDSALRL